MRLLTDATSCVNLKNIMLNERSQRLQGTIASMIPYIRNIQKKQVGYDHLGLQAKKGIKYAQVINVNTQKGS